MKRNSIPTFTLERVYLEDRTLGSIYDTETWAEKTMLCKTLEEPWRNNERRCSCIPEDTYLVIYQKPLKSRPYEFFRVQEVPNRSGILIHIGNDPEDTEGCILVGAGFNHYNTDKPTLYGSKRTLEALTKSLPRKFYLKIIKKP